MITVYDSFIKGLAKSLDSLKLIFFLYLFNVITAGIMILPFYKILNSALVKNTAAEILLERFDYMLYSTISTQYEGAFGSTGNVLVSIIFYIFLSIFFAGGIFSLLIHEKKFLIKEFLNDCISNTGRYFKLFMVSLLYYIFVFLFILVINRFIYQFTADNATEVATWLSNILSVILVILIFLFINMIFDYAKTMIIADDSDYSFSTALNAFKYVFMNIKKTTVLYLSYTLILVVAFFIFMLFRDFIIVNSTLTVVLFILFSQFLVFLKIMIRFAFFAGQTYFYQFNKVAMPMLNKEMLDMAVSEYEKRAGENG